MVGSIAREELFTNNSNSKLQCSFEYSDGMIIMAMTWVQAESGKAYYIKEGEREKNMEMDHSWAGTGHTLFSDKASTKQYEPYFRANFRYEDVLKKVKEHLEEDVVEQTTLLLFSAGYQKTQKERIQKYAEGKGATVHLINSADDLVSYFYTLISKIKFYATLKTH